ncbi:hypothetical protein ScPMuIL_001729 [Solemya velum]
MENWKPNPKAKPYVPKKYQKIPPLLSSRIVDISKRRFLSKVFQGALILVLLMTVVINVTFILDTSKKLTNDPQRTGECEYIMDWTGVWHKAMTLTAVKMLQPHKLSIEVVSSKELAAILVDGTAMGILHDEGFDKNRGIHVLVLNQATGSVMAARVFDTYNQDEDKAMIEFVNLVTTGRVIIFTIKDEGTFHLKAEARHMLKEMGSLEAEGLGWRDMWAMVVVKGGSKIAESHIKAPDLATWAGRVRLEAEIPLSPIKDVECDWPDNEVNQRRKMFCSKREGYGDVCSCSQPAPLTFDVPPVDNGLVSKVPIAVIASDRPHYLFRMLRTLLSSPGANPAMVTVFIDGYFEEPLEVTKLYGLRGIQHTPLGMKNARISQHYKASLTASFNLYPEAQFVIVIEEDLDVSQDFLNYFGQLMYLFAEDPSLYCISAWNDQGYEHSCKDSSLLYRVETMPGLGWMLSKKLYKDELEPQWPTPEKQWDWDMWMRTNTIRKDRECIIPDISRTYHFGSRGLNMNPYFQEVYFKNHSFVKTANVKLKDVEKMKKELYEETLVNLIKSAKVLDHSKSPCEKDFIPQQQNVTNVMYIHMNSTTDYVTWNQIAKCFHLWDLDVRGFHKSMWRMFMGGNHLMIIGFPVSEYAKFKPDGIKPIYIPVPKKPDS